MFKCKKCDIEKHLSDFYPTATGHRHVCKACCTAASVQYQKKNPEGQRWKQLKHKYGLTKEQWCSMLNAQDSKCACCDVKLHTEAIKRGSKRPSNQAVVDHCHETGAIRGILCHSCNVALGHVKDDITILHKAIKYLENSKCV